MNFFPTETGGTGCPQHERRGRSLSWFHRPFPPGGFPEKACRRVVLWVALSLLACAGCGKESQTCTVSGAITFQGNPVTQGLINFMPENGRPEGGAIQADGTYRFELSPGKYLVRIDTPPSIPKGWKEGDSPSLFGRRQIPMRYGSFQTSRLTLEIRPEESEKVADYALK